MPRPPKQRALPIDVYWSNSDHRWHGFLPTGEKNAKGEEIRLHRACRKPGDEGKKICEQRLREAEAKLVEQRAAAVARAAAVSTHRGAAPPAVASHYTVHSWLRYWLETITKPNVSYNTYEDYRRVVHELLIPNLPDILLAELRSDHIEEMLRVIRKLGSHDKPNRAYRHLKTALKAAEARPLETGLWYNPIKAVKQPTLPEFEVKPLTVEEIRAVLVVAAGLKRNGARWIIALALGLRQGEALSLRWDDIDLDEGILWVRTNTYRRRWLHGCSDPHACGAKYHKQRCPGAGMKHDRYHRNGCPAVKEECPDDCVGHAPQCPLGHGGEDEFGERQPGGKVRKAPKSRAGKRPMALPAQAVAALRAHKAVQDAERLKAGDRWRGDGSVFATRVGTMLNERDDWGEWRDVLLAAGVNPKRLHDARHSAATNLLRKKIDPLVVIQIMGWSGMTGEKMRERYSHVVPEMLREAADGVADLIWGTGTDSATTGATTPVVDLDKERRERR